MKPLDRMPVTGTVRTTVTTVLSLALFSHAERGVVTYKDLEPLVAKAEAPCERARQRI